MYPRLQTVVKVDLVRNVVLLQVRGSFTTTTYRALLPMIRRAHAFPGNPTITVDITSARHIDPRAAGLLTAACDALIPGPGTIPLHFIGAGEIRDIRTTTPWLPRTAAAYSLAS